MENDLLLPRLMHRAPREDILSEALAHVLTISATIRNFVGYQIISEKYSDIGVAIDTQQGLGDGRYDLLWDTDASRILFEIKIGAGWHPGQPNKYIGELLKSVKQSQFVLLAPSDAVDALRADAVARLNKDFDEVTWDKPIGRAGAVRLSCISWKQISKYLARASADERDDRLKMYAEEVIAVINEIDPGFASNPDNLSVDGVGPSLHDLSRVVDSLPARLASGSMSASQIRSGNHSGLYFGFYLTSKASGAKYWFGIWLKLWAQEHAGPLWLTAENEKAVSALKAMRSRAIRDSETFAVPIRLEGKDWDAIRSNLIARLSKLA